VTRCGLGLCLNGAPYQFTGLNIYNANSRDNCWYPLGYADSKLGDSLTAIGSGQEVFRAWFFERLAGDWAAFDHTIAVAKAHNMRIIATLADQWGNCENESGSPIYKDVTWYQSGYKTAYRAHVQAIVSRYRNEPTILAWQLMNEAETKTTQAATVCPTNSLTILRDWAVDMSGLVKSIDPDTLVSIGTIGSGQCGAQGDEYRMLHSIPTVDLCEYHDYQPEAMAGDQWNGLAVRLTQCAGLGKPLFVGESGQKGLSREDRAALFAAKFSAQFDGGVSGILIWDWSNGPLSDGYEVLSGDPSVALFDRY